MESGRGNPVPIIDAKFCSAHAMNLLVKLDKGFLKSTTFKVLDANTGKQLLQIVKGDSLLRNKDWLILDASDSILATLRHKTFSWSDVWRVYKRRNTREEEALCKVKRQDALTLNVFIGSNQDGRGRKGDFDVVGFPPIVYMNDDIVANVNNNFSWGGDQRGKKGGFKVKVNGGVDYVFIVALIIIHREMAMTNTSSSNGNEAIIGGGIDASDFGGGDGDGGGGGGGGGGDGDGRGGGRGGGD